MVVLEGKPRRGKLKPSGSVTRASNLSSALFRFGAFSREEDAEHFFSAPAKESRRECNYEKLGAFFSWNGNEPPAPHGVVVELAFFFALL